MIISLTEKCSEGCSHCFINSLPRSPIMAEETLWQVIAFLDRTRPRSLLLSGGEFTEHPEFHRFAMEIIKRKPSSTILNLLSNGSWFFDSGRKEKMLDLMNQPQVYMVQIRTHQKYYPNFKRTIAAKDEMQALSPKLTMFDDGIRLYPLGRALANHKDEYESKIPTCTNFFLIAKQGMVSSFRDLIHMQELRGRFCAPFVSSKGIIHAGETPFCEELGHVTNSDEQIFENISKRCKPKNKCGLMANIDPKTRAIAEKVVQ